MADDQKDVYSGDLISDFLKESGTVRDEYADSGQVHEEHAESGQIREEYAESGQLRSKYAHFEDVPHANLHDIYGRHGEIARDIHQDILRQFTGNPDLTVDLVRLSPLNPVGTDVIDTLGYYDVVSVSTSIGFGGIIKSSGLANAEIANLYKERFDNGDMPVYVTIAGNNGNTLQRIQQRVADFGRASLVVGESNNDDQGPYIEEHSSKINPTILSDNPFNRGVQYQYYNTSPSLEGHEDLVRKWQIDRVVNKQYEELIAGEGKDLSDLERGQAYFEIRAEYSASDELDAQVKAFMDNPETLHALVMAEIREERNVDENGFATGIDGTSFSGPEQAGYVSGAMYEQEQREENNLPILTREEIISLVKMATVDTQRREGQDMASTLKTNQAGFDFVHGAGHGVFQPDMFRTLLDEAYNRIEKDPDIDRDVVTTVMSGEINNQVGSSTTTMRSNLPENTDMVIDRMRLDVQYGVNGLNPQFITISKPDTESVFYAPLQYADAGAGEFMGWTRVEDSFGEHLNADHEWVVKLVDDRSTTVNDMSVTVYGYNKGGLMDQMMDYSKVLAAEMTPQSDTAPEPADVPVASENEGQEVPKGPGGS